MSVQIRIGNSRKPCMENSLPYLILSSLAIRSKFVLFLALVFIQGKWRGLGLPWSYTLETGFKCLKYVSILTSFPLWLGIVTETKKPALRSNVSEEVI